MRKYVYGPINSRRLGKSLGVDLIVPKVCPLDCIYCEARATTDLTMVRREYVNVNEVIAEILLTIRKKIKTKQWHEPERQQKPLSATF